MMKRYSLISHQKGFLLLSVIFAAIIIGIIALYSARLEQGAAASQQIERTTARMNQWLEAALAFYYDRGEWPISLDYARQSNYPSYYAAGPEDYYSFVMDYDLTSTRFMPASVDDYPAQGKGTKTDAANIVESPTATAWSNNASRSSDVYPQEYLIRAMHPSDFVGGIVYQCSPYDGAPLEDTYTTQCQQKADKGQPFGIEAVVPTQAIAQQIAAKLPASKVKQQDDQHWLVQTYVSTTPTQSTSNTPGAGKFSSGYISLNDTTQHWQGDNNLGFIDTNCQKKHNSPLTGDDHQYTGNQSPNLGSSTLGLITFGSTDCSIYRYYNMRYKEFSISNIQYNTEQTGGDFGACNQVTQGDPNLVISAPGFETPAIMKKYVSFYAFPNQNGVGSGFRNYYTSTASTGIPIYFEDTCSGTDTNNLSTDPGNGQRLQCVDFLPYSSLYGVQLVSIAKYAGSSARPIDKFLLDVVGMSTQAQGASTNKTDTFTALKDLSISNTSDPTSGDYPADRDSSESDNPDHFWAQNASPYGTIDTQNGISGVNYFFYCNAK